MYAQGKSIAHNVTVKILTLNNKKSGIVFMQASDMETILSKLIEENPSLLLSMVISPDGLPLCFAGNADNFDLVGALYIQLKITCDNILADLGYGETHEIFVRSKDGCIVVYPISNKGVLACMAKPEVNAQKMQILAWKAVIALDNALDI